MNTTLNGYYRTHTQEWFEDSNAKGGWSGYGWGEDKDFELIEHLESDKFGNPTKALFKYTGAVMLGHKHSAYNVQVKMLYEFIEIAKQNEGITRNELFDKDSRSKKLSDAIDLIEEMYGLKEWLNL